MLRRMTTTDSASGRPAIMAGFTVALLAWGLGFYGPGVLLAALHERHGWPVATVSAAITVHFLSGAVLVARFPALQARLGLAWLVAGGGVLLALGIAAWSLVPQAWMLFPAALVSGAGWALTSGAAVNAIVAPWFERGRPAALSYQAHYEMPLRAQSKSVSERMRPVSAMRLFQASQQASTMAPVPGNSRPDR